MNHVAEIEHPGDAGRVVRVHEKIVRVEVVVDDLRSKPLAARKDLFLVAVQRSGREATPARVADVDEQRPQLWGALNIPQELPRRGGMTKVAERAVEPREAAADRRGACAADGRLLCSGEPCR